MAEKRMFSKTIIDSDAFLEMPTSAQALYFHLAMRADDDGFINNPRKIQRVISASDDDLKILLAKRFLIPFESGIVVIKHWRMHNYIAKDRYKPTVYQDEKSTLAIKENGSYTECIQNVDKPYTECIQNVDTLSTQIRLDKNRLDKNRLDKNRLDKNRLEEIREDKKDPVFIFESCKSLWNNLEIPPRYRFTFVNVSDPKPILRTFSTYEEVEILAAIKNYNKISKDNFYTPFPVYTSLENFLSRGVEKYVDEAEPFKRCRNKDAPVPTRAPTKKYCPYCKDEIPGTMQSCLNCGWTEGDDVEENKDWYSENLKRKR